MEISKNEFNVANKRLQESLTYTELFKAIKKPLESLWDQYAYPVSFEVIEKHLESLDKQHPDKRLTAQWLSNALANKDYNTFIAELKTQTNVEQVALETLDDPSRERSSNSDFFHQFANKIDFEAFEKEMGRYIDGRFDNRVLESDFEVMATAAHIMNMIFGQVPWVHSMIFRLMGDRASVSEKVNQNRKVYWVQYVEFNDGWEHPVIAYSCKEVDSERCEPSEEECEEKDLEFMTESQMKSEFAWNNKRQCPATTRKGKYDILIPND